MYWFYLIAALTGLVLLYQCKRRYSQKKKWRQAVYFFMASILLAFALEVTGKGLEQQTEIQRNQPGEGSSRQEYQIDVGTVLKEYPIQVEAEEKKLSETQRQEYFRKAQKELDRKISGKNKSTNEITSDLSLPGELVQGAVKAAYHFSDYEVFSPDGTLRKEVTEPIVVEITAELECQEEISLYRFFVKVIPKEKTSQEILADQVRKTLQEENEKVDTDQLVLPKEVGGQNISWKRPKEQPGPALIFLGAAGAACILLTEKEQKKKQERARQRQLQQDYPEIVSKLNLLLGAGMTTGLAWEKIVDTYQRKQERRELSKRFAYEEMAVSLHEIQDGVGELQAYERFGERCRLPSYRKLSSLLTQNLRRGNRELQQMLEDEVREAFEERKSRAKKAGEEAGTKLLLPMVLMLVVVLIIIIVPAGMAMNLS